jgi:hypothetical protein
MSRPLHAIYYRQTFSVTLVRKTDHLLYLLNITPDSLTLGLSGARIGIIMVTWALQWGCIIFAVIAFIG